MISASILEQATFDKLLAIARNLMEYNRSLQPGLLVQFASGKKTWFPLRLPDTPQEKGLYFFRIGCDLYKRELIPMEAVFITDSWFVDGQKTPTAMGLAPSEHPCRQEAIVAIGRSADNNRYTHVIQPYRRDKHHGPIWQPIPFAVYDEEPTAANRSVGLLDCLFDAIPASS